MIQSPHHAAFTSFTHTHVGAHTRVFSSVQSVIYVDLHSQKQSRYRRPLMLPFYSHSQLPPSNPLEATNLISISRTEIDERIEHNLLRLALFTQRNLQNKQVAVINSGFLFIIE